MGKLVDEAVAQAARRADEELGFLKSAAANYTPKDDAREVNGIVMGDYGDAIVITMVSEGRMTRFRCKPSVVIALLEEAARICARRLNAPLGNDSQTS